jgi:hypothetical protein
MIMRVGVVVDVLDGTRGRFVDMNDAHGVIRVGQAWRRESAVGERERQGRHQDAKHIDRGKDLSCPQPSCSRQPHQHRSPINRSGKNPARP